MRRWTNKVKIDIGGTGWQGADWIRLAEDWDQ
jgi:hypothetical protein